MKHFLNELYPHWALALSNLLWSLAAVVVVLANHIAGYTGVILAFGYGLTCLGMVTIEICRELYPDLRDSQPKSQIWRAAAIAVPPLAVAFYLFEVPQLSWYALLVDYSAAAFVQTGAALGMVLVACIISADTALWRVSAKVVIRTQRMLC
ncbi:MAG: hypothetical protein AAGA35_03090 [Patescibacteria group bacterium]